MTKTIQTSIVINAPASKVWEILTDFKKYPSWNPFIKSIKGNVEVGQKIEARIQDMTFKPLVLVKENEKELKWLGKLFFKGLFDGEHQFLISENGNGSITFHQNEKFTGLLVGMFAKSLNEKTKPGFEAMNLALKQLAEKK